MSRLGIAILTFMFVLSSWAVAGPEQGLASVVASGTGPNRKAALDAALRSAVETAVGMTVRSSSQVINAKLMRDSILVDSAGQIDSYEILEDKASTIGHMITLKAQVRAGTGQPVSTSSKTMGGFGKRISAELHNNETEAQATQAKLASALDQMLLEHLETSFRHEVKVDGEDVSINLYSFEAKVPRKNSYAIASAIKPITNNIVLGSIKDSYKKAGCPIPNENKLLLSSLIRASWLVISQDGSILRERGPDMDSYVSRISDLSQFASSTRNSIHGNADNVTIWYPYVISFGPFTKDEIESIDRVEFRLTKRCNYGGSLALGEPR